MVVQTWLQKRKKKKKKRKKKKRKKEKRKITYEFLCNKSIIRIRSYDLIKKDHDVVELSRRSHTFLRFDPAAK